MVLLKYLYAAWKRSTREFKAVAVSLAFLFTLFFFLVYCLALKGETAASFEEEYPYHRCVDGISYERVGNYHNYGDSLKNIIYKTTGESCYSLEGARHYELVD